MPMATYGERQRQRRRRRFWSVVLVLGVTLVVIIALGRYAYQTGTNLARSDVVRLEQEITALSERLREMETENNELHGALAAAKMQAQDLRQQYERDVPTGAIKDLLDLSRRKLAAGVDVERLAFVVGAVENTRDCKDAPVTRRFLVRTPISRGANDSVNFAENAITVTASGLSATDGAGNVEAWFDPAHPITVLFAQIGGAQSKVEGSLPLHHSVVMGDREFKFSIVAGARGFANVTGDECRYP